MALASSNPSIESLAGSSAPSLASPCPSESTFVPASSAPSSKKAPLRPCNDNARIKKDTPRAQNQSRKSFTSFTQSTSFASCWLIGVPSIRVANEQDLIQGRLGCVGSAFCGETWWLAPASGDCSSKLFGLCTQPRRLASDSSSD